MTAKTHRLHFFWLLLAWLPCACDNVDIPSDVADPNNANTPLTSGATNSNTTSNNGNDNTGNTNNVVSITPLDPNDPTQPVTTTDPNLAAQGNQPVVAAVNGVRSIGRIATGNILSWPGTAIEVSFAGTGGNVVLQSLSGNNYVALQIDGTAQPRVPLVGATTLPFGPLSNGNHVVRITKTSEARLGTASYTGLSLSGNQMAPSAPSRRIEFIGDSITAGYGIDGTSPCTNTAAIEDATFGFAQLTANQLNADASIVAWAGLGVLRNDTSDPNSNNPNTFGPPVTMPTYWLRQNGADASSTRTPAQVAATTPDVVVLALGTNDFEYAYTDANGQLANDRLPVDHNAFVNAYVNFVQQIEGVYPSAKFVLAASPMLNDTYPTAGDAQHTSLITDLHAVANTVGTSKASVAEVATLPTNQLTGCGLHPTRAGHVAIATTVVSAIKSLLTW